MRTRKNPNINYFDAFNGKSKPGSLYANLEPLDVPQYRWQLCLSISLPSHVMNQCYDKSPIFYKNAICFVDPITRQTHPDAQVQNCSDRSKSRFQFDMEHENSWFTITPTLEHRKRPAVFGPKVVTPVSRSAFGGAGDAGIYT